MFKWIKNLINKIKQELAYRKRLKELSPKPCRIDVSLSDEKNFAIANVLISQKNEI